MLPLTAHPLSLNELCNIEATGRIAFHLQSGGEAYERVITVWQFLLLQVYIKSQFV